MARLAQSETVDKAPIFTAIVLEVEDTVDTADHCMRFRQNL